MTEADAKIWLATHFGDEAVNRLAIYVGILLAEADRQSLIAKSTYSQVWARHIVDSAQLAGLGRSGIWIDIGSGAGLPGLVVALLRAEPMVLIEPRRKRAEFLRYAVGLLQCDNVEVIQANAVSYEGQQASVVSARAVSSIDDILAWTTPYVSRETIFLLPRGKRADADLVDTRRTWHGSFHVEQSLTDTYGKIVVGKGVGRR